jgi:hypothetical protein
LHDSRRRWLLEGHAQQNGSGYEHGKNARECPTWRLAEGEPARPGRGLEYMNQALPGGGMVERFANRFFVQEAIEKILPFHR